MVTHSAQPGWWRHRCLWMLGLLCSALVMVTGCGLGGTGSVAASVQTDVDMLLAEPVRYVTDITQSEAALAEAQRSLKTTFFAGLRGFDWALLTRGLAPTFRGRFPRLDDGRPIADAALTIRQYEPHDGEPLTRDQFIAVLRDHTASWVSVERADWQVFTFMLEPSGDRAFVRAHLQLGGPASTGGRAFIDATVAVRLLRDPGGEWSIDGIELVEGSRVDNPRPPFRDITDAVGFHLNRSEVNDALRQDIIDQRMSLIDSGLSVVDWNGDQFWDLIVTESMNHSVVFVNDGKGGFVRDTLPIDDRRLVPSQLLQVDLDGDGLDELVGNRVLYRGDRGSIGIYTRREGVWTLLPRALEFESPPGVRRTEAQPMTAGDVNGDGRLDLVIAGYETNQSRDPQRFNRVDATDGADNLLFINHGDLQFTEESDVRGITGTRYTYTVQLFDFDGDGDLDLFEGNDYGRNMLWDNRGDGRFEGVPDHPLVAGAGNTMGITVGDWDNRGVWSVYLSNMYSHAGHRVVRLTESLGSTMQAQVGGLAAGSQLFTAAGPHNWEELGRTLGVDVAEWAWGSLFYDLDNDGDKELFVTNGNTSHRDPDAPDY